jgi:hypothetical protein
VNECGICKPKYIITDDDGEPWLGLLDAVSGEYYNPITIDDEHRILVDTNQGFTFSGYYRVYYEAEGEDPSE